MWPCSSAGCSLADISHEPRQLGGQPNRGCQELLPLLGSRHSRHAAKCIQDGPTWQTRSQRGASTCRDVPASIPEQPPPSSTKSSTFELFELFIVTRPKISSSRKGSKNRGNVLKRFILLVPRRHRFGTNYLYHKCDCLHFKIRCCLVRILGPTTV